MEERPLWLPKDVDLEKPSAARCYDYFLGGAHNFAADRELGRRAEAAVPNIRQIAQDNRAFLRRAVRFCLSLGIRQFLDIGSGIPTVGNVHEIAQQVDPQARVVYVDNEPVAVAHSQTMLDDNDFATMIKADFVDVESIVDNPETRALLDFTQPVAIMIVALVHFVPPAQRPRDVIHRYYQRIAPGSCLGFSHATNDHCPEIAQPLVNLYANSANPATLRSYDEVADLVADFELVEPGLVYLPEWRPDTAEDMWDKPETSILYGGVGRKA